MKNFKQAQLYLVVILQFLLATALYANTSIKPNSPTEYVVKKGDTLWDIAGVFLNNPWSWPKLWENNEQIKNPHLIYPNDVIYLQYRNGQPYLSKNKSGVVKLSPKVRDANYSAIKAIPDYALKAFVQDRRIVEKARVDLMPYVLSGAGLSKLVARGDEVLIKGVLDPDFVYYDVYRLGNIYDEKFGLTSVNAEIMRVATLKLIKPNGYQNNAEINRALVLSSKGLVKAGDIVVRQNAMQLKPFYFMANAPVDMQGSVLAAVNSAHKIALYDGLVVDLGKADAVYPGHMFDILAKPYQVKDPRSDKLVEISDQIIGKAIIVNVFENISYAVVMSSSQPIAIGAKLRAPK